MTTPSTPIGQARIRIRADFSGFREKVREETESTTSKPATIPVKGDTTEAKAKLAELRADLDRLRTQTATAKVRLDGNDKAQAQLDKLDLSLRRLGVTTARPKVSVEGVERAKIQLDELQARLAAISASGAGRGGGRGGSTTGGFLAGAASHAPGLSTLLLGAAAPLAIPAAGAALGAGAGLLAPTVAGGIGLGAFGVAAKQNIATLSKTQEQYDKLQAKLANTPQTVTTTRTTRAASPAQISAAQQRLDAAQLRLSTAEASVRQNPATIASAQASVTSAQASLTRLQGRGGTTSTTKDNKAYQTLLKQEHDLLKTLDPAQRQAIKNVDALQEAWKSYKKALEPQSFKVLADGAKIGTTGLGLLLPVAKAVGNEVDLLEKRVEHALTQPFWKDFFGHFLAVEAPRAIDTLGTVVGNVVTGIGHLAEGFAPLGHDLEGIMVQASARFEHWTEGEGPGKFVAWVEKNGPQVAKTIQALASGVGGIAKGLSPIAAVELKALTPVLKFIGDLGNSHPGVITAVGVALLGVGAGLKVIAGVKGVTGVIAELKGLGKGGVGGILGGKGGGLGDVTSRGSTPGNPVYVWVVDQTKGGPSGPGGAASTVEKDAEKAAGAGGFLATVKTFAKRIGPASLGESLGISAARAFPLYAVGGQRDLGPSTQKVPGGYIRSDAPASIRQLLDQVHQLTTSNPGAAQSFARLPSELSTTKLQEWVREWTASGTQVGSSFSSGVSEGIREKLGPAASKDARIQLGQIAANAQRTANDGGYSVGTAFTEGLAAGLAAEGKKARVLAAAGKLTNQAIAQMQRQGLISSPSKRTMYLGEMLAQGLAVGFTGYTGTLLKSFDKTTLTVLGHLGGQLSKAADQYRTDLQGRADLKSSVAQGIMGSASIANATLSNTGGASVSGFLAGQIRTDMTLDTLEKQAKARGLDPRLIQQAVEAGPQQGAALLRQMLSGSQASIRGLNAQERTLSSLSQSIGGTVADTNFAGILSRDQAAIDKAATALEKLVGQRMHLDRTDMQQLARDIASQFAHVFPTLNLKTLDHALGIQIVGG